jgi:metal-responsive CopG/Arc/MetJ family transcriptional regulator
VKRVILMAGVALAMTVKLSKELWAKVTQAAAAGGYSSPEEFIEHVLEREVAKLADDQPDEEVVRRLRGLGYVD